ncbi:ATP-dependent RNA helicase SUV3 mitochondrial precursor [Dothidotthia symphoricarpi CBS 119687]|uniref:RNA helicase n=1 Tax=Dothidotthia symphoricarpi CBS 119687 TaxID=1392245 RepID=A0A6A6ADX4_9PLEO|nr:ATP-dependent RNA helicase SUV3 mitochondrial precursor [Dothidotthia symphoricarpi CBS 119687]KAF2129295.1 ATP-dependent RNA helicase SUV3 mitochondrial precursor [Dothidotthia symphoricarpi CBS 119687]
MPRLPARRNSLCLFCAFARPPPRLLPRIQIANRTSTAKSGSRSPKPFFNVLDKKNPFRFQPEKKSPSETVSEKLDKLRKEFAADDFLDSLQLTSTEFDQEWVAFERSIAQWVKQESDRLYTLIGEAHRGKGTLETELRYRFYAQTCGQHFTSAELENQKDVADLRYPSEWYPSTREIPRVVHMHVGPTNSGKTYRALKRLEEAHTGIYLGPLRLLAHEVYTRLNAKGKECALVTGEEQRLPEGDAAAMFSCTVEMAPLNTPFDVAVIDEIQMISHPERGWAWTQAFLGLQAKEIHLCGEARTVPLMRELCALVGDEVHVHEYNRLTPLKVEHRSLRGNLSLLEKGDCIVAFTILGIHALRREIEKQTSKKCAIIYGSLPPETRAQQARLFNDPDNDFDYLVASDAIGMGLNLAIKRVIFESTMKNNGTTYVPLQISEVKQIAGRAGRYKTAHQAVSEDSTSASVTDIAADPAIDLDDKKEPDPEVKTVGWVTTLDQIDHDYLRRSMEREPEDITSAGVFPPSLVVERFASYFPPGTPFSYIMLRLHEICEIHPRFHLCALKDQLAIADVIHPVKNLSIQDRITICAAPINTRQSAEQQFLRSLAECVADGKSGSLLDLPDLPLHFMDLPATRERSYLYKLEQLHKMIVCYLWLSYRFPNVFTTRPLANHAKKLVEDKIEKTLTEFSFTELARERMRRNREKAHKGMGEDFVAEKYTPAAAAPGVPVAEKIEWDAARVEVPPVVVERDEERDLWTG